MFVVCCVGDELIHSEESYRICVAHRVWSRKLQKRSGLGPICRATMVLHNLELKIFWRTFSVCLWTYPSTEGKSFREALVMARIFL